MLRRNYKCIVVEFVGFRVYTSPKCYLTDQTFQHLYMHTVWAYAGVLHDIWLDNYVHFEQFTSLRLEYFYISIELTIYKYRPTLSVMPFFDPKVWLNHNKLKEFAKMVCYIIRVHATNSREN